MFRKILDLVGSLALVATGLTAPAQAADDTVRVTVTMNPDGSKTVYQNDSSNHQSIATTTGADAKARGKIIYKLDANGGYESGQVFAANGALRLKTLYQYDAAGRLTQETQLAKDESVRNKIVDSYDAAGHQAGYAVYDGDGKLLGRTTAKKANTEGERATGSNARRKPR
jgi:hypothetical protein